MAEIVPSVLSMVLAIGTATVRLALSWRSAWIHTNPTTNVHTEGCVKNKFWANSRDGVGLSCSHARSQQSPNVRGTLLRAQQAAECLRDGVYFILLMRRSNLASCTSTISWKEAFLLPSHQGAAKHLHLHFMDEKWQLERHQFAQGHTRLLTASSLAHVQPTGPCCVFMSRHLKSFHSQPFGVRSLDGQASSWSSQLCIMIPQNGNS